MKKSMAVAICIVALIPLYCGATWLISGLERSREAEMWKKVEEQSQGQLKVLSRKIDSRFFTASEDIKLQLNNPVFGALLNQDKSQPACSAELTLHNDIAFGPLPKFSGLGIARIETSVVLPEELRKKLIESIGNDKPLQFISTLGSPESPVWRL